MGLEDFHRINLTIAIVKRLELIAGDRRPRKTPKLIIGEKHLIGCNSKNLRIPIGIENRHSFDLPAVFGRERHLFCSQDNSTHKITLLFDSLGISMKVYQRLLKTVKTFQQPSITIKEGVNMKTDVQMSFRTTEVFKKKLEQIAEKERRPTASLIKIILEDYVEQYERKNNNDTEHK